MRRLLFVMCFVLVGYVAPAAAQTTVQPGDKIRLAWEHDGLQGVSFRVWLDGSILKNLTPADIVQTGPVAPATDITYTTVDGVVPPFTVAQIGAHVLAVSAYNSIGESAKASLSVNVNWSSAPTPPKTLRTFTAKVAFNQETGEVTLFLVEDKEPPPVPQSSSLK